MKRAIPVVVLVFVLLLGLGGCGSRSSVSTEEAQEAVDRQIRELIAPGESDATQEFVAFLQENVVVEVKQTAVNDEQDVALCVVTAPDTAGVLQVFFEKYRDEEMTYAELNELLLTEIENAPLVEKEVSVPISAEDDLVAVELSEEFFDAMYGGLLSFSEQFFATLLVEVE